MGLQFVPEHLSVSITLAPYPGWETLASKIKDMFCEETPSITIFSKCPEKLKMEFGIPFALATFKSKYPTIIKNCDATQPGKVTVEYY